MILFKKLLIIGCGRSGTKYTSTVLSALGADMPHEKIGKDGMVSWKEAFQPKWKLGLQYSKIFHQVRSPLGVINSCQTIREDSWKIISNHIPVEREDQLLIKCMKYWYYWNLLCERRAHQTFQVEQMQDMLKNIAKLLAINPEEFEKYHDNKINTRRKAYQSHSWEDLEQYDKDLVKKCKQLALKYGYEIS